MLFLALLFILERPNLALVSVTQFSPPSSEVGMFMQQPGDIKCDDQGRLYVVDLESMVVFVWNADGSFLTHFGKKGKGPGEFWFLAQYGGAHGFISPIGDQLYIFDAGARFMNLFGGDFRFKERKPFSLETGRVESLRMLGPDKVAINNTSFFAETPNRSVVLYSMGRKRQSELIKVDDKSWYYTDNRQKGVLNAYCATLTMAYNEATGEIIVGHSKSPSFQVFDANGQKTDRVQFNIKRLPVDDADITEFKEEPSFKGQNFFTAKFPDFKAYYDRILPLGKDRFLVFNESPLYRNLVGYVIGRDGSVEGEFKYRCGQGGRLYGSHGRLFAASTNNSDGDFQILELTLEK